MTMDGEYTIVASPVNGGDLKITRKFTESGLEIVSTKVDSILVTNDSIFFPSLSIALNNDNNNLHFSDSRKSWCNCKRYIQKSLKGLLLFY